MKKILTSGIVFSALIGVGSALAAVENDQAASSLTTKGYVDTGLKYVYDEATDASAAAAANAQSIQTLQGTVSGNTTAIEALQTTVNNLNDSDTTYSGGDGITINANNEINIEGLATTQEVANQGKKYIYQNGTLQPLEIEDSWNAGIFD